MQMLVRVSFFVILAQLRRIFHGFCYFSIQDLVTQRMFEMILNQMIFHLIWRRSVASSISIGALGRTLVLLDLIFLKKTSLSKLHYLESERPKIWKINESKLEYYLIELNTMNIYVWLRVILARWPQKVSD